jgi:hypothetical protein
VARWIRSVAALALALGACGGPTGSSAPPSTPALTSAAVSPPPSAASADAGALGPFLDQGCQLDDEPACEPAAELAQAIVDGDGATIVGLSRSDTFTCSELDPALFPGCAAAEVLEGHAVGLADGPIEILVPGTYRRRLDDLAGRVDPTFTDELGDGRARVLGTSSCGPSDPARRSHYVAWTAATAFGAPPARTFGIYELTFRDDGWRIGVLYIDVDRVWVAEGADPLPAIACGVTPWGSP